MTSFLLPYTSSLEMKGGGSFSLLILLFHLRPRDRPWGALVFAEEENARHLAGQAHLATSCGEQDARPLFLMGPPESVAAAEGTVEPAADSAPRAAPSPRDVFPRHLPPRRAPIGCLGGNRGGAEWLENAAVPVGGEASPFAPPCSSSRSLGRLR